MTRMAFEAVPFAVDGNRDPVSGGKLYVYDAGTTAPAATFSDEARVTPQTHPILADAAGIFPQSYLFAGKYKYVVTDAADVTLYEADNIIQGDDQEFNSRSEFLAESAPVGDFVMVGGKVYARDANGTALTAGDGSTWTPVDEPTPKHWGAVGDGVADDTAAVQAFFDFIADRQVVGYGGVGTYRCTGKVILKSNTIYKGSLFAVFVKDYTSPLSNQDGLFTNENYAVDPVHDENIRLHGLTMRDGPNSTLGAFMSLNWIHGLTITDLNQVKTSIGFTNHICGRDVYVRGVNITSGGPGVQFCDGLHFEYLENAIINDLFIDTEDDCVAFHYQAANNSSAGPDKASRNIVGSNWVLSSEIANAIRIGAGNLGDVTSSNLAHPNAQVTDLTVNNIVFQKVGAIGRCVAIYDERTNFSGKHSEIMLSNLILEDGLSAAQILQVEGAGDHENNQSVRNVGDVQIRGVRATDDGSGGFIVGGSFDSLSVCDAKIARSAPLDTEINLRNFGELTLSEVNVNTAFSVQGVLARDFDKIKVTDCALIGDPAALACVRIEQPNVTGGKISVTGSELGAQLSVGTASATSLDTFTYVGNDDVLVTNAARFSIDLTRAWENIQTGATV